ncbi:MAG: DUF1697 domain-containing protein [bacterium]
MTTYISILRGINVSGQKKILMTALKKIYEELHFSNIQTYIQSGNVVFKFLESDPHDLALQISGQIQKQFGFYVPVIVLTVSELEEIIVRNPFLTDGTKKIEYQCVTFLDYKPEEIDLDTINKGKQEGEEFAIDGKSVYLYCPYGFARTKLSNTFFEKKLKVNATTRNWKTTTELLRIATNQDNFA